MKMKLILLTLTIASVIADTKWSRMSKPKLSNNSMRPVYLLKTPEERRKLAIFPKSTQKYVINPSLHINTSFIKKPVVMKTAFKETLKNPVSYSRKPYTFQAQYNKKTRTSIGQTEETASKNHNNRNDFVANQKEEKSSEEYEINEPIESSEKSRTDPDDVDEPSPVNQNEEVKDSENNLLDKVETTTEESLLMVSVKKDKEQNDVPAEVAELLEENYEEKYPFVRNRRNIQKAFLPVERNGFGEVTAEYFLEEYTNFKTKRSIIEEENLASTVSGFKFTGVPESRLTNKLNYNNINE